MLTKTDEKKVEVLITKSLDKRLGKNLEKLEGLVENVLDRKLDEKLDEKLSHLPTKEEFFSRMDKLLGEVQKSRDEQTMLSARVSVHSDQIEEIQKNLGIQTSG